jgi:regulator of replication initiation timing
MKKKNLTPEQRRALADSLAEVKAELGNIRTVLERRLERKAELDADDERRRARLRRLTFGLLGRA